jgi:head-tail adaptor
VGLSTFLYGGTATQLRGLAWLALDDTGVVQSLASTTDSGGGATQAWTNAGTSPCRIDPLASSDRRVTGGQIDERSTHAVTVPSGFSVTTGNRFAISGRGTFEVTAARVRTGADVAVFEVLAL